MNAMNTKRSKQETTELNHNGRIKSPTSEESKEVVIGTAETAIDPDMNPANHATNLDQAQQPPDSNTTVDVAKPYVKDETDVQEQVQDGEGSGAPSFNDEDLFGFDPSPLPTPQPADLDMEDANGGVPLTTELAGSAGQVPETEMVKKATDDLDDLFGGDGMDTDDVDLNTTEQQDTEVSSLLPGLEFYANENNATPGRLDVLGDMSGAGMGALELPELNGEDDGSGFMMNDIGDGQTATMGDSTFDDWLSGLGGGGTTQNGEGLANGEDAQFDANFFNLD